MKCDQTYMGLNVYDLFLGIVGFDGGGSVSLLFSCNINCLMLVFHSRVVSFSLSAIVLRQSHQFFINMSYHILVASLTLMALF